MYALIQDGAVAQYPYSIGQLRRDNPRVSFPRAPDADTLAAWGVHDVVPTEPPSYDDMTQRVVEQQPTRGRRSH